LDFIGLFFVKTFLQLLLQSTCYCAIILYRTLFEGDNMIKVTVWNEFYHERHNEEIKKIYPQGLHKTIADFLKCDDITVRTATLLDEDCGLTQEVLDDTDVLIWWGHVRHREVPDEIAERVQTAVLGGMGAIFLHSAHHSKPFKRLIGTTGNLSWREDGDWEKLWNIAPAHPITQGIGRFIELEHEEVYCEPFDIPNPDQLIFISNYEGGEVFRSGCCYNRGCGKIFYFKPGHESYPIYYNKEIQTVIKNAVYWAKPVKRITLQCPHIKKIGEE
jgi:trehalose utilization protein